MSDQPLMHLLTRCSTPGCDRIASRYWHGQLMLRPVCRACREAITSTSKEPT